MLSFGAGLLAGMFGVAQRPQDLRNSSLIAEDQYKRHLETLQWEQMKFDILNRNRSQPPPDDPVYKEQQRLRAEYEALSPIQKLFVEEPK